MTWISWDAARKATQGAQPQNPGMLGDVMKFLQSPEVKGLAVGMLKASQPNMTQPTSFGGALGEGLATAATYADLDRKRKVEEKEADIKQGQLDINKDYLGLDRSKFGLEKSKHAYDMEQKRKHQEQLNQLFNEVNNAQGGTPTYPVSGINSSVPNEPVIQAPTVVVTNPTVNGGVPTEIPADLNGRKLTESEAVDLWQARQIESQLAGGQPQGQSQEQMPGAAPQAPGMLNQPAQIDASFQPQMAAPQAPGMLNQPASPPMLTGGQPPVPPPVPPVAPVQAATVAPKKGGGTVKLGNGLEVSKETALKAKTLMALGYEKEGIKLLLEDDKDQNLTGIAQQVASVDALGKREGYDSDIYKQAKRGLDAQIKSQEQMMEVRQKMLETADKRYSTSTTKLMLELQEAAGGFVPGTGGQVQFESPAQQQQVIDNITLKMQKENSDADTRKRTLFASNIDKTIKQIDVDALTQYAGLAGEAKKKLAQGQVLLGGDNEKYSKYMEALTAAETLAMQVRQFYGESITPTAKKAIEDITNPANWKNNPSLAKRQFQKIVDILENETETFRGGLTGTQEYRKQEDYNQADLEFTAKKHGITVDELKKRLEKKK